MADYHVVIVSSSFQLVALAHSSLRSNPRLVVLIDRVKMRDFDWSLRYQSEKNNWQLVFIDIPKTLSKIIFKRYHLLSPVLRLTKSRIVEVVICDYGDVRQKILAGYLLSKTSASERKLTFLDDGNSSVEFLYHQRSKTVKRNVIKYLIEKLAEYLFYGIWRFGVSCEWETMFFEYVDKNRIRAPLKQLKFQSKSLVCPNRNRVLILGSVIYQYGYLSRLQYYSIVTSLAERFAECGLTTEYLPHPREDVAGLEHLVVLDRATLQGKPLEFYVGERSGMPATFVSFLSTASFSLKLIYPEIRSYSLNVDCWLSSDLIDIYREIQDVYERAGVLVIDS